jgi:hypothetical protein
LLTVQAADPPVGFVEVTTLPLLSTATQKPLLVHDTPVSALVPSTLATNQGPTLGSTEVTTSPLPSTAAQKPSLGQDTPVRLDALAM